MKKSFFKTKGKYFLAVAIGAAGLAPSAWGLAHGVNQSNNALEEFSHSDIFALQMQLAESDLAALNATLAELQVKVENGEIDKSVTTALEKTINERKAYYYSDEYKINCLQNATDTTYYHDYNNTWQIVLASLGIAFSAGGAMIGAPIAMALCDDLERREEEWDKILNDYKKSMDSLADIIVYLRSGKKPQHKIIPFAGKSDEDSLEK